MLKSLPIVPATVQEARILADAFHGAGLLGEQSADAALLAIVHGSHTGIDPFSAVVSLLHHGLVIEPTVEVSPPASPAPPPKAPAPRHPTPQVGKATAQGSVLPPDEPDAIPDFSEPKAAASPAPASPKPVPPPRPTPRPMRTPPAAA